MRSLPRRSVNGLLPPLAPLVPEGETPTAPNRAFRQGRTLPLKLQLVCGTAGLTDIEVASPEIVGLSRLGEAIDLTTIDLDAGAANDNGPFFRFSDAEWVYNLSTTALTTGTYEMGVRTPEGVVLKSAFVLR